MCGIVGYSGFGDAVYPVIEGLSRLEYRGYDSAGICYSFEDKLINLKREGKLNNLKLALDEIKPMSHRAIGHTRWATHGKVNQQNAHPHKNDDFAVVHNGIIENAGILKETLEKEGYVYKSETDSETFLVLVTKYYGEYKDIKKAIVESFKEIRGNSSFVIMSRFDNNIYSIRRAAPLVVGENQENHEVFASSDPYALVGFTTDIYFPEDEVLCESVCEKGKLKTNFYDLELHNSNKYTKQVKEVELAVVAKGNYEHFMLKEIHEQPKLIKNLLDYYRTYQSKLMENLKGTNMPMVHISACGTAWHAGLLIKEFLERINKQRVNIELASEFRYKSNILNKDDAGLFISQSGETADTLATLELCKEAGMRLFSIVNVEGSSLYRECERNFLIHAGVEIGVASTKAFTQQVLTGYLVSKSILGEFSDPKIDTEFNLLATKFENILKREDEIKSIALKIYNYKGFIFTGRGRYFPVALEGALKLKEIAYVHAEGYASGELKHGPIALIDQDMVNIALVGPELYEKTVSNIEEVKARRGVIVTVGPQGDKALEKISDHYFGIDFEGMHNLSPLLTNVFLQLLSYHVAKLKGTDIDKPRNLAKSVTVE
jgi:glutamine---fructose-6-phosphate transaminase (isomerizing)